MVGLNFLHARFFNRFGIFGMLTFLREFFRVEMQNGLVPISRKQPVFIVF